MRTLSFLRTLQINNSADLNRFHHYTNNFATLHVSWLKQLWFVKKQTTNLTKLPWFYKENSFPEKTVVNSYFYQNNVDISQSHQRRMQISPVSNKNIFATKNIIEKKRHLLIKQYLTLN